MAHIRRIMIVAFIAMVLGAFTTVALAWALAEWRPLPDGPPMAGGIFMHWDDPWPWSTVERHKFGVSVIGWARATGAYVTAFDDSSIASAIADRIRAAMIMPEDVLEELRDHRQRLLEERPGYTITHALTWGTFARNEPPPAGQRLGSDVAFGWPMRCMWYQVQSSYGGNRAWGAQLHGGILRRGQPSSVIRQFRALPLMPIWRGLIGNILFFAAVWIALLLAPIYMRLIIRRRRGWCVACGYDLAGSPQPGCPECGYGRGNP